MNFWELCDKHPFAVVVGLALIVGEIGMFLFLIVSAIAERMRDHEPEFIVVNREGQLLEEVTERKN